MWQVVTCVARYDGCYVALLLFSLVKSTKGRDCQCLCKPYCVLASVSGNLGSRICRCEGWPEPYIHCVYDRIFGDFPAKYTV